MLGVVLVSGLKQQGTREFDAKRSGDATGGGVEALGLSVVVISWEVDKV